MAHVATHLKEPVANVEKLGSPEWFALNESLIIKQSKPIVDPLEGLDEETKVQVTKEYLEKLAPLTREDDLMQLLSQDYDQQLHKFYTHPQSKLHEDIQYTFQPDPKPFNMP